MNPIPKLLILNQMAGPLTWELAVDAAQRFGSVEMLTGHPDTLAKTPPAGLRITAAPVYRRGSYVTRIGSWLRFLYRAHRWVRSFHPSVPVLWFSNPPLSPWLARRLSTGNRHPYAVMVHDIYPDLMVGLGKLSAGHPIVRLWVRLNRRSYESAQLVMTLGEYMADRLGEQFDPRKTGFGTIPVIPPWADTETLRPRAKAENPFALEQGLCERVCIMYSGNMGVGHDLETVHEVATGYTEEDPFRFLWIGAGPKWEWLAGQLAERPLNNATLLGWQPEERLPETLAAADLAVVSLEEGIEGVAIPSKAFSFFAVGAALLLLSGEKAELARLVREYDCGWVVKPGDVEGLRTVLETIRKYPEELARRKANSRRAAETIGSRKNSGRILDRIEASLLNKGS